MVAASLVPVSISPTTAAILALLLLCALLLLERRVESRAQRRFEAWQARDLGRLQAQIEETGRLQAQAEQVRWRAEQEAAIRADAALRSTGVLRGRAAEQLVPFLPDFPWDPRDARFLGSPVDLVVFDGLSGGGVREIVFVEVKTGSSSLSGRERSLRDAVRGRRIAWREWRVPSPPT
jgi:predicted Holliday junction resolvase-like endonuclease